MTLPSYKIGNEYFMRMSVHIRRKQEIFSQSCIIIKKNNEDIKITAFWDVTPCSLVHLCRYLGETCYLHLHRRRIVQNIWVLKESDKKSCGVKIVFVQKKPCAIINLFRKIILFKLIVRCWSRC
jgi:hypothetical protein